MKKSILMLFLVLPGCIDSTGTGFTEKEEQRPPMAGAGSILFNDCDSYEHNIQNGNPGDYPPGYTADDSLTQTGTGHTAFVNQCQEVITRPGVILEDVLFFLYTSYVLDPNGAFYLYAEHVVTDNEDLRAALLAMGLDAQIGTHDLDTTVTQTGTITWGDEAFGYIEAPFLTPSGTITFEVGLIATIEEDILEYKLTTERNNDNNPGPLTTVTQVPSPGSNAPILPSLATGADYQGNLRLEVIRVLGE